MITEIDKVIPEKNIIILSPHYDDVPLTFGGYLDALVKNGLTGTKKIRIVNVFSFSNFMTGDDEGNNDVSVIRVQHVTGIRIMEDMDCMNDLMGKGNYTYEIVGENECLLRQKAAIFEGPIEFLSGDRETFEEEDWIVYGRLKKRAHEWLSLEDTAVLIPMGVKEHIDHMVLREAVMDAKKELGQEMKAVIYFGEDQPYTGLADHNDWSKAKAFVSAWPVADINYVIDEKRTWQ